MKGLYSKDQKDTNHSEIVSCLKQHGYEVVETERPVDIWIFDPQTGLSGWGEIKVEGSQGTIKRSQLRFMSDTAAPVQFIRNEGEALIFASNFKGLTAKEKEKIAVLLYFNKSKTFSPKQVAEGLK